MIFLEWGGRDWRFIGRRCGIIGEIRDKMGPSYSGSTQHSHC